MLQGANTSVTEPAHGPPPWGDIAEPSPTGREAAAPPTPPQEARAEATRPPLAGLHYEARAREIQANLPP